MDDLEWLGKIVGMTTKPGSVVGGGKVIAYCPAPMVCVMLANGKRVWWRADLCEIEAEESASPSDRNDIMEKE